MFEISIDLLFIWSFSDFVVLQDEAINNNNNVFFVIQGMDFGQTPYRETNILDFLLPKMIKKMLFSYTASIKTMKFVFYMNN